MIFFEKKACKITIILLILRHIYGVCVQFSFETKNCMRKC